MRVRGASGHQNCEAVLGRGGREAVVNVGGGVQKDAGMAMIVVVTINEVGNECPRGADGAGTFRKPSAIQSFVFDLSHEALIQLFVILKTNLSKLEGPLS